MFDVTFLDVGVNCTEKCLACCLVTLSWFCATIFFPCGICSGMKCVNEYERLILYKFSQQTREYNQGSPGLGEMVRPS